MKICTDGDYLFQNTKITSFSKMLREWHETGSFSFSKVLQNNFKVKYSSQITIETSALPARCVFKRLYSIF